MSLKFNQTNTKDGIIQRIESLCGMNDGDISGNTTKLAKFTGDVNVAYDYVHHLIFSVGTVWQFDDANHTDYPIITTNLVADQRDYAFTADGSSNLVLDIYKVLVTDETGYKREISPVYIQGNNVPTGFHDGQDTTGQPNTYGKIANGIFLDPIPSYSKDAGLEIYINREGSYFTTGDTTKKPGFAGLYHEYLAIRPSYFYCLVNAPDRAPDLEREMLKIEAAIKEHYKSRDRDVVKRLTPRRNRTR